MIKTAEWLNYVKRCDFVEVYRRRFKLEHTDHTVQFNWSYSWKDHNHIINVLSATLEMSCNGLMQHHIKISVSKIDLCIPYHNNIVM